MSVRLGGIIPKEIAMNNTYSAKNKKAHWKWVCIEGNFNFSVYKSFLLYAYFKYLLNIKKILCYRTNIVKKNLFHLTTSFLSVHPSMF